MALHNSLTDPNLHEPKGASTASAGQIYVANGSGSGVWTTNPSGWGFYQDDTSEQTFNTTAAKLTINGLGSATNTSYLPLAIRGINQLWDTTNNEIVPVALGDSYSVRVDLPVTARSSANYATLSLDVGGGVSPSNIIVNKKFVVDHTAPFSLALDMSFHVLSTMVANGGQLFLTVDTGSIGVTAPSINIVRTHGEIT